MAGLVLRWRRDWGTEDVEYPLVRVVGRGSETVERFVRRGFEPVEAPLRLGKDRFGRGARLAEARFRGPREALEAGLALGVRLSSPKPMSSK